MQEIGLLKMKKKKKVRKLILKNLMIKMQIKTELVVIQSPVATEPSQDDLNVEDNTNVSIKLRIVESNLEKECIKKEQESPMKTGEDATDTEKTLMAKAGEKIPLGSVKDFVFNTENMQNLFNFPIFDTFVKDACGLLPLFHFLHSLLNL